MLLAPSAEAVADEELAKRATASSFSWPVQGRVIANFGANVDGQQNEGINLAVPEGTAVRAAEDGVVAYAGSELKGYGNLILIRHANGFVTGYAHASEIMVIIEPYGTFSVIRLSGSLPPAAFSTGAQCAPPKHRGPPLARRRGVFARTTRSAAVRLSLSLVRPEP